MDVSLVLSILDHYFGFLFLKPSRKVKGGGGGGGGDPKETFNSCNFKSQKQRTILVLNQYFGGQ